MIVLITGDFGVGKDTVADLLLDISKKKTEDVDFVKILSYTTREPRYEGENTHLFCTKEDFLSFNDILASTKIGDYYYGTRFSQFNSNNINLYCVDDAGIRDVINADIDKTLTIEVVRPKELINVSKERLERKRYSKPYNYFVDYRIENNKDMDYLRDSVLNCYDFVIKEVKKTL